MKEFKLTTMAVLIGSLLVANNLCAKIYDNNEGIITGSGILTEGGDYKIVSTAGENNTLSVANNGGITITNPGGTPIVNAWGEFENGDFTLAPGTVYVTNSGTINLGSGSTVNQITGDFIPGTVNGRPDLALDEDYHFLFAVGIIAAGGTSDAYRAQKGVIIADDLTINISHQRDGKAITGIYSDKNNGVITLTGDTTVNATATGANGHAFGVYAKKGSFIDAENIIINNKSTEYAVGIVSESQSATDRSLVHYQNATVKSVADDFADGINANGGYIEASGDTSVDVTANAVGGVASAIWLSDGPSGINLDSFITTHGTTTLLLKSGADRTVLDGVDSMGSSQYTGNVLNIALDTQGHQQTTGTGILASKKNALTAGKIDINGHLTIDVVDTTRSGSWHYVRADKGGEITLNGGVQMGVSYNDPDATAILAENAGSRVTINPQNVQIVGTVEASDSAVVDISATSQSRFVGGTVTRDNAVNNLSLAEGSAWNMTKSSQLTHLTLDDSTLTFMPTGAQNRRLTRVAPSFKTLRVNGDYTGANGNIVMNTQLGDDASPTDRLIVTGNTSGTTNVSVLNAGGAGGLTTNGIELISVAGNSAGEFRQNGRIVAGAYDYTLQRGEGQNTRNWYLSSALSPATPASPGTPVDPQSPSPTPREHAIRPEAGLYGMNLQAANTMFNTRLQDRLGETHYVDALTGEEAVTSLWLRNVGGHTRQKDSSDQLNMQSNRYVMQLGGDIAQWSSDNADRYHLGLMAGYANQKSRAENQRNDNRADSRVSGYSVGLYGTWLQDNATHEGAYVDTWAQYSWFDNTVSGRDVESEEYDSSGFTASVESGYTWKLVALSERNSLYIQPKAQVTWMGVKADEHKEVNGTRVEGNGDGNLQTRVGVRLFGKGHNQRDDGNNRTFQPFVEANWIHNTEDFGVSMNGENVNLKGTRNIGELKAGVEGQLTKNVALWGNVAQQAGDKGYSDTSAMIGIKASF
ncbi:autotransporter outer membrane beta-barrel domain-containing protein [Citrobacter farmeri]|uniref:autotransporter outer membrane beta-barrel domain-containing protein n=1 Tax=Citrobacter amalonaticus TaxID=35703 RepID=UPI0009B94846|nr:autotransporter outer membrane beta-barrel domain-containing protein [Citrobacter amalonaticus]EKV5654244.1 autotransporter outer membrane beta-barrel domain-containing protein [Citrobacter farmeri]